MHHSTRLHFTLGMAMLLAVLALGAAPANAGSNVDQSQPIADGTVTMPPGIAQTFTVGRSGSLDGITVVSATGGPAFFALYGVGADGTPDTSVVYTAPIAIALNLDAPTTVTLPAPVPVAQGQRITIALGTIRSTQSLAMYAGAGDPYPAGDLLQMLSATNARPVNADLEFTTWVSSQASTELSLSALRATRGHPTAVLTSNGSPLAGRVVDFALRATNGKVRATCSAVTDASGRARCAVEWEGRGDLVGSFAGDAEYQPVTAALRL